MSAPDYVPDIILTSDSGTSPTTGSLDVSGVTRAYPPGATLQLVDGIGDPVTFQLAASCAVGDNTLFTQPFDLSAHNFLAATPTTVVGFSLPILAPNSFYYRGLIFGQNVGPIDVQPGDFFATGFPGAFQMVSVVGFDLPALTAGDAQRPLDTGQFVGANVMGGRDITIQLVVAGVATDGQTASEVLDEMRAILGQIFTPSPAMVAEFPLFFTTPGGDNVYECNMRPTKLNFTIDKNAVQAAGLIVTAQLHATDPRLYLAPTYQLVLTSTSTAVSGSADNDGFCEYRPQFTITAGAGTPSTLTVRNQSIDGTPALIFVVPGGMANGDQILVDTGFHTAWYVPASGDPYDALPLLASASSWWNAQVGSDTIQFTQIGGTSAELKLAFTAACFTSL